MSQFLEKTWRQRLAEILRERTTKLRRDVIEAGGSFLYGALGAMTLWPVFEAMKGGDLIGPLTALGAVAGQIGGNLLGNELNNWRSGGEDGATNRLAELAAENEEMRKALDAVLDKLETVSQISALLSDEDRRWFADALKKETKALGSCVKVDIHGDAGVVMAGGDARDIAGHDIVKVTIGRLVLQTDRPHVESLFHDYLTRLWGRLINLPMGTVLEIEGSKEVPLTAVYTALDVTSTVRPRETLATGVRKGEMDQGELAVDLRGDKPYIDALLERMHADMRESMSREGRLPRAEQGRRVTALEAVAASSRRVLLGLAGSGKSTFAKYVALCLAGETLGKSEANLATLNGLATDGKVPDPEHLPWPHGALLPIFIELRRFAGSDYFPKEGSTGEADHLLAFLEKSEPCQVVPELAPYFREYLMKQNGGALLILDGLDETPEAEKCRGRLRQVITSFAATYPTCRILVTSRPYAYTPQSPWRLDDDEFFESTLAPFDDGQVGVFVSHWYSCMAAKGQIDPERVTGRSEDLQTRLRHEKYLQPLAGRPLMLTMIADLHARGGGTLPTNRAKLYEASVGLLLDRWNQVREIQGVRTVSGDLGLPVDGIRAALEELAYRVHGERGSSRSEEAAEITAGEVWEVLDAKRPKDRTVDQRRVINYLSQRSGILLAESESVYRFPHRTYQEYLAACHLIRRNFPDLFRRVVEEKPQQWREAVLFGAGKVAGIPHTVWALLEELVPEEPPEQVDREDVRFWLALYSGLGVRENGLYGEGLEAKHEAKLERIRLWLRRTLEAGALPPPDRAEAGRVLALLGDDRPGVGLAGDGIPDIDWVKIPAGSFLMGSRKGEGDAYDWETPQRKLKLPAYRISRHPVTNAQFRGFVEDGGYTEEHRDCWTAAGLEWRGDRQGPDDDLDADFLLANHPRVNVAWYEAVAFSRWLGKKLGREVRLPTEGEWERAARGEDGRKYPWGNEFDSAKCNMAETGVGLTSAVGMFPEGASPYGVDDMSGNAWEWCVTGWRASYEDPVDEGPEGDVARVVRGGAFGGQRGVRCAYRIWSDPSYFWSGLGFRVAAPV